MRILEMLCRAAAGRSPAVVAGLVHPCNYVFDRLATLHFAAAVIEYSVLCEGRDIEIGIVKVEREEILRLQVLNFGAILCITANGTSLRIHANRIGRHGHHDHRDERSRGSECQGNCHLSHIDLSLKNERTPVQKI